ncbi:shikimate kinase [Campylobacterota bacterium]|nr:shikimate kinase [Campylobacterota bacterium]
MNNTLLTGFMGSGKSSVGRLLARASERYFLDTDALIEARFGVSIGEIFKRDGEAAFRAAERDAADFLARSVSNAVIATGGGMPVVCENLRSVGVVIYLKCDFETIAQRLAADAENYKRPLAASIEALRDRFYSRLEIYEKSADFIINAALPKESVLKEIVNISAAVETDLTDEEKEIIREGRKHYAEHPEDYVSQEEAEKIIYGKTRNR